MGRLAPKNKAPFRSALWFLLAVCPFGALRAQSLAPRAYVITPDQTNAVILTESFYNGGLNFNGTIPITGATGTYSIPTFSYYHSFSFFGRSANFTAVLPYGVGTFQGSVLGTEKEIYRSGLADAQFRLSVNLKGGPAMSVQQFAKWKQKLLLGASLVVIPPTGQYDGTKIVNWGTNRWSIKPELGYSQRWGNWILDAYGGVWLYGTNNASYDIPLPEPQSEGPVGSFEGHLSYDIGKNKRFWVSLDGNFWFGGVTSLNGIPNSETKQTSSRVGTTVSLPIGKHQSVKIAYSVGDYVRFGGNYHNVQVAWQYFWIGWRPK